MNLQVTEVAPGIHAYYRPDSSDERIFTEVIEVRIYRRKKIDFDVERGERWLDLGANIGAFALYCKIRGAVAECYEPDSDNFEILRHNVPEFKCHRTAVTVHHAAKIPFYQGRALHNYSRATAFPSPGLQPHPELMLANIHASALTNQEFDGVKMDIEGAEFGILDANLLPKCRKLVMEYHSSRDASADNLKRRLEYLQSKFPIVSYPPEFDRIISAGVATKTYFDRMIFARQQ
jgi:FkbM family methyltransferase